MASLRFSFGTMGSGKSTLALQIHHNLSQRGLQGILCSQHVVDVVPHFEAEVLTLDLLRMGEHQAEKHGV